MVSNKMFPLSTSSNNTYGIEALINIDNSENLDHQLNTEILKILAYYEIFCEMFFFFLVKIFVTFVKL